jgi:predicted transcriptional regulator
MVPMKVNTKTKVHVGGSLRDAADGILADVVRFEHGEGVNERHLIFENWQALFAVLTPKRYELLQHVHKHPEPSVRALARVLDRDFKRVYEDVKALVDAGLLEQDADGLRAEYERIETAIAL